MGKLDGEEFSEFQSVSPLKVFSAASDKLAALKALVQDTPFLAVKLGDDPLGVDKDDPRDGASGISSATLTGATATPTDVQTLGTLDWASPTPTLASGLEPEAEDDWADFESAAQPVKILPPEPSINTDKINWHTTINSNGMIESESAEFSGFESAPVPPPVKTSKPKPSADTEAVKKFFHRNIDSGLAAAGTGMSPLDFAPPDLPEDAKDDEEFDEFGTFQRGNDINMIGGISSLGGFDDFEFAYPSRPRQAISNRLNFGPAVATKDAQDSQFVANQEFTGWSTDTKPTPTGEDNHSINSLDLEGLKAAHGSKVNICSCTAVKK